MIFSRAFLFGGPDDAAHVRQPRGLRGEAQVLELDYAAVEALDDEAAAGALAADHTRHRLLTAGRPRADDRTEELLERAAEHLARALVRSDVAAVVIPDDEAGVGGADGLAKERDLDLLVGERLELALLAQWNACPGTSPITSTRALR